MTAKEYLKSIRHMDRQIDAKLEQATRLRAQAERITTTFSPTKGSGRTVGSGTANSIDKLIDLEREINVLVDQLVDRKREALDMIQGLPWPAQRTVMELRYLTGYSWGRIAAEMHYSTRQVHYVHGGALARLTTICGVDIN